MSTVFIIVTILSALWGVIDLILIVVALDKRGIKVNMVLFRLFVFRYLKQYKQATLKETGKVGSLYYSYIIAMNIALICAIMALMLRPK